MSALRWLRLALVVALCAATVPSRASAQCQQLSGVFSALLTGTTSGASADAGSCGGGEAPEASFVYLAPRTGTYVIDTIGTLFDTVLYLRDPLGAELTCRNASGNPIACCNDDISTGIDSRSRLVVDLNANQLVTIVVDGFSTQGGDFVLRINGDCPRPFRNDPRDLGSALSTTVSGSTVCAANFLGGASCPDGGDSAPDGVFVYTAPVSGSYLMSTEGSSFDTILSVRLGTCTGDELKCNDDAPGGTNQQSRLTVNLSGGQTVIVAVDGFGTKSGNFALSVNGTPFTPTVTPSRTGTRTPSLTATITQTASMTATASITRTRTPTRTATGTLTSTSTRTRTPTPSRTITPTATATATSTPTVTPSRTRTNTLTSTPTSTPTASSTPTRTLTATRTPTATLTFTLTPTASRTQTPTWSSTPSSTRTPTRTGTPLPTATFTASPSATPTPSRTRTGTATSTGTLTPTTTPTVSATRTPTPTPTPTPTFDGLGCCQRLLTVPLCTAPVTISVCAAVNGVFVPGGTCVEGTCIGGSPIPTPTSTSTPTRTLTRTSSPSATSTPSSPGCCQRQLTVSACDAPVSFAACLAASGTFVPGGACVQGLCVANPPTATVTGTPSVTASVSATVTPTATASLTVAASSTPTPSATASATPTATATPSATASATVPPTVTHAPPATATATVPAAMIALSPASGIVGSAFIASGHVAAGAAGVRVLWNDGSQLLGLAESSLAADGSFRFALTVPEDAASGTVQVCAVASGQGALGRDLGCSTFSVLPTPVGSVTGVVTDQRGMPVPGVDVRLTTGTSAPVSTTTTDTRGRYSFTDLPPGDYLVGANCAPGGTTGCSPAGSYFPPTGVTVVPGSNASKPLGGIPPPLNGAALADFGGIALPGGALSASAPVRVTSATSGVVARLGSLQGVGLAPLNVRFWSRVEFFEDISRTKSVLFQILQAGDVLASKTATGAQPVFSADPTYTFGAYVADFNVNDLPAGDLTLRITPLLGGFSTSQHDVTIRMIDLASRWFHEWVTSPTVAITAAAPDDLLYSFTGLLPTPAFDFNEPITLPFGIRLENIFTLGIPIEEAFHSNEKWSGKAQAVAALTVLSTDLLNETRSYNGPSGDSFLQSSYHLDTIHKDLAGKECVPIPQLFYCVGFTLDPCLVCPSLNLGVWFQTHVCVQAFVNVDSQVKDTLRVNARVSPGATVSVPIQVKFEAVVCSGSATAEPAATATLPIYYDPDRSPLFGFDDPCLNISAALDYKVKCVGITVVKGKAGLGNLKFGCSGSLLYSPPDPIGNFLAAQQFDVADLSPSPSVAADGTGHALAVWIQEESQILTAPDRRLYFSVYNGTAWTPGARLADQHAVVDEPKVTFIGPNRALAVWVQSTLSLEAALVADQPTLLGSSELYFSVWDGSAWSSPAAITSDAQLDTSLSLAGDPATGTAVVAWLRSHADAHAGEQPIGVYAARFDGTAWGAPLLVSPRSQMIEHPPQIKFDRHGQPVALWVRDTDGTFLTSEDRQIVLSQLGTNGWSTPEVIPNLPAGAYTPSFAFDTQNNPIVAFVVPPLEVETGHLGSGDGNSSTLYAAYRNLAAWTNGPVGVNTHAERPVINVNPDDQAIIVYRQFGDRGDVHVSGDLAAAVTDLRGSTLTWSTGFLTADGQVNWETAFDIDSQTANNFILNVKKGTAAAGQSAGAHAATALAAGDVTVASTVVPYAVDLAIAPVDITFANAHPLIGDTVTVTATVHNLGLKTACGVDCPPFTISVYDGDARAGAFRLFAYNIPFNRTAEIPISFTLQRGGLHTITVVVDEGNEVAESDKSNNAAQATLGVVPAPHSLSSLVDSSRGSITLQWEAPETRAISRYQVYRSQTAGTGHELVGGATDAVYQDVLAAPGVTYHYVVAAIDVYGVVSPFSNEVAVTLAAPTACIGDCDGDGAVTIDELLTAVNIALEALPVDRCAAADANSDGNVTVDELLVAVNNALSGCPQH